jgi:hypothetical protein
LEHELHCFAVLVIDLLPLLVAQRFGRLRSEVEDREGVAKLKVKGKQVREVVGLLDVSVSGVRTVGVDHQLEVIRFRGSLYHLQELRSGGPGADAGWRQQSVVWSLIHAPVWCLR